MSLFRVLNLTIFVLLKDVPEFICPLLRCVFIVGQIFHFIFRNQLENGLLKKKEERKSVAFWLNTEILFRLHFCSLWMYYDILCVTFSGNQEKNRINQTNDTLMTACGRGSTFYSFLFQEFYLPPLTKKKKQLVPQINSPAPLTSLYEL